MQTFSKKCISFEQIEIFECFQKHCKVQEAYFYEKNHELDGNKKKCLSLRCQLALFRKRKNVDVY